MRLWTVQLDNCGCQLMYLYIDMDNHYNNYEITNTGYDYDRVKRIEQYSIN